MDRKTLEADSPGRASVQRGPPGRSPCRGLSCPSGPHGPAARLSGRLSLRASLSAAAGVPDVGLLTLNDFVEAARSITLACSLPLLCDADTGFGEALDVECAVHLFESAGVAGIHLEGPAVTKRCGDLSRANSSSSPKRWLPSCGLRCEGVATPSSSIRPHRRPWRDGVLRMRWTVPPASEVGADAIFPLVLESADEFAAFAQTIQAPLLANMTEFGRSPNLGFCNPRGPGSSVSSIRSRHFAHCLHAAEETLAEILKRGHQRDHVPQMSTRAELDHSRLSMRTMQKARPRYFQRQESVGGEAWRLRS